MHVRFLQSMVMACALVLAGCCATTPRSEVADAIDLCGSIGKLQAANTYYMGEVKSLTVKSKATQQVTYPELTPELRVSAMRSTSHCINLTLKRITPETYDKLMALEASNAAAAERALTSEQLEQLMAKGYRRVADILREAKVSDAAIAQVAKVTEVTPSNPESLGGAGADAPIPLITEVNTGFGRIEKTLGELPAAVVKAMNGIVKPGVDSQVVPLAKVLFAPGSAALDAAALLALHRSIPSPMPDVRISVVGSADAHGDELSNIELSRRRAESVAAWLMVNRQIEPRRIHIGARGAEKRATVSPDDRSVALYTY